jgi:hypothetical protein
MSLESNQDRFTCQYKKTRGVYLLYINSYLSIYSKEYLFINDNDQLIERELVDKYIYCI